LETKFISDIENKTKRIPYNPVIKQLLNTSQYLHVSFKFPKFTQSKEFHLRIFKKVTFLWMTSPLAELPNWENSGDELLMKNAYKHSGSA
jgi:hypothetical protein